MTLEQVTRLPGKLPLCDDIAFAADHRLSWLPHDEEEILIIPKKLQAKYADRLSYIERVLLHTQKMVLAHDQAGERNPRYEARKTRELVKRLFPVLSSVISESGEKTLFHGKRIEEYVDKVAFLKGKAFREWVVQEHLPRSYWQSLELCEDVDIAGSFLDLVRIFGGKTVTIAAIPDEPEGTIYNRRIQLEVVSLLDSMYLAALVDLSRRPEEEKLLRSFTDQASSAFPFTEDIRLLVNLDPKGKCVQRRIHRKGNDVLERAKSEWRKGFINHPYLVRRFGPIEDEVIILHQREKTCFSEMLKVMRGRPLPITDRQAVRFILGDKKYFNKFFSMLKERLSEWSFEKERLETRTPSSRLPVPQVKYFAWRKGDPTLKIEVVFEWLSNEGILKGSWIPYRYEREINFNAFRMRQLLEGPLQILFPFPDYPFDWSDPLVRQDLFNYANYQATR